MFISSNDSTTTIYHLTTENREKTEVTSLWTGNEDGDTCLHLMILHDREDLIPNLLYKSFGRYLVNVPNHLGQYPIHLAVLKNKPDIVRRLILHNAQVNVVDNNGMTALHIACASNNVPCAQMLTMPPKPQEVRDYQAVDNDLSPCLTFQVIPQDDRIRNFNGETCLHIAAQANHYEVMDYLINCSGFNINVPHGCTGETVLHMSIGDWGKLQRLLMTHSGKIDINARRYDGKTAYDIADCQSDSDQMHILKMMGANIVLHATDEECEPFQPKEEMEELASKFENL